MTKRVFIIHGWGGTPEGCFKPWLKQELEERGYSVVVPALPDTNHPRIEVWIPYLQNIIGVPDEHTILVGHSLGGPAILRYLETLPPHVRVGKVVLVAPAVDQITGMTEEETVIAEPWLKTPLNTQAILQHTENIVAFFSDNDECIPLESERVLKKMLGARTIIEHNMGHYSDDSGVREVPTILEEILR